MYRVLFAVFRYQAATTALFSARHTGLSMSESVGPFVLKMVRFILSKGQNVQIPGAGTSAVPRTDDFLCVFNAILFLFYSLQCVIYGPSDL